MSSSDNNIWKKWQEDSKRNLEKFQQDWNSFFGIPEKKPVSSVPTSGNSPTEPSTNASPNPPTTQALVNVPKPNAFTDTWSKFVQSSQNTFQQMQSQWKSNFDTFQASIKQNNVKVQTKMKESSEQMKQFFTTQQQEMNGFFKKIETDLQQKSKENNEKFFQGVQDAATNWGMFVKKQQTQFEKNMGSVSKLAWRAQFNFIIWLIPVLILFVVIFSIIRPFIPY